MKCRICDKEINKPKKLQTYCSKSCYQIARSSGFYPSYWLGKKRSDSTKNKIKLLALERYRNGTFKVWCEGKSLTPEHKKKLSDAKRGKYVGSGHPNWRGGKHPNELGYEKAWAGPRKRRYTHRVLMEEVLNRPLKTTEVVHHIDGNKGNNAITNLMVFSCNSDHIRWHAGNRDITPIFDGSGDHITAIHESGASMTSQSGQYSINL